MPTSKLAAILAIITILWRTDLYAQNERQSGEVSFSFELYRFQRFVIPYRQAVINQNDSPTRMVIYLHGGTSRGSDNTKQMEEPGIDSISQYLSKNNLSAVYSPSMSGRRIMGRQNDGGDKKFDRRQKGCLQRYK